MLYKTHPGSSLIWFLVCEETSTQPWQSCWRCRLTVMVDMWNYGASSSPGIGRFASIACCKFWWSRRHSEALVVGPPLLFHFSQNVNTDIFLLKTNSCLGWKVTDVGREVFFFLDTISANKKLQIWDKYRNEVLDVFPNNSMKTLIYFYVRKVIVGTALLFIKLFGEISRISSIK